METATLDDFMALNDQLAALAQAEVPLDVGLGASGRDMSQSLDEINATIARRVSRGQSLAEALDRDTGAAPAEYLGLMKLGLRSGDFSTALDGSHRLAETIDDSRYTLRSAFFYPLVICGLAYFGLIGFCLYFVPTMEGMFESLRVQPGPGLRVLMWLRDALPYWAAIPPILLLLYLVTRAFRTRHQASAGRASYWSWLPGMSLALFQQRCANFATTLATLLEREVTFEEGLILAAGASGDDGLDRGAKSLAESLKHGQLPSDETPAAHEFPPFLRWALWHSEATTGRARALRMAAGIYRESAQRRAERWQIIVPILACVVIGGGVTLLYGLALFKPLVEMLRAVSS